MTQVHLSLCARCEKTHSDRSFPFPVHKGQNKRPYLCVFEQARLWMQCMHDLRNGVKLKKTNYTRTPVEYELTPYEMLMDDIRSRCHSNLNASSFCAFF